MDGGSLLGEVFDQDGGSLVDEDVHTLHVALEGGQVQRCPPLAVSHIQVQQRLYQHLHSMVVAMVCLKKKIKFIKDNNVN